MNAQKRRIFSRIFLFQVIRIAYIVNILCFSVQEIQPGFEVNVWLRIHTNGGVALEWMSHLKFYLQNYIKFVLSHCIRRHNVQVRVFRIISAGSFQSLIFNAFGECLSGL